jgi:hypothetical protein
LIWSSGTERQHAEDQARPEPDAHLAPVRYAADDGQCQRRPAKKDSVEVAEAGQLRVGGALLHQPHLLHHVAAKERVEDRRREPAQQVGAEHQRIAPPLQVIVGGEKRPHDWDQRRRPDEEGGEAEKEEIGELEIGD